MNATKELARGFGLWFTRIMFVLTFLLWTAIITVYCQHSQYHSEFSEWEDTVRFKVIDITGMTGDEIQWQKQTRMRLILGAFSYDHTLRVDKSFTKNPKGCHQAWYCANHFFVYMLAPVDSKYCR